MKACRICQQQDVTGTFTNIFENNGNLSRLLFDLFGTIIVDNKNLPALICRKCENSIMKAHQLKLRCAESDVYYRDLTREYEHYEWNDNLNNLRQKLEKDKKSNNTAETALSNLVTLPQETEDDYADAFQFLDELANSDNGSLLKKITEITALNTVETIVLTDDDEDPEVTSTKKYDNLFRVIDTIDLTTDKLKLLTDQVIAVLPPYEQPLKLRINLRKLQNLSKKISDETKKSKKSKKKAKDKKVKTKQADSSSATDDLRKMLKLRPRRNSLC